MAVNIGIRNQNKNRNNDKYATKRRNLIYSLKAEPQVGEEISEKEQVRSLQLQMSLKLKSSPE